MRQQLQRHASASYFTILSSLFFLFLTPSVLEAQIQGKVYRDFNANGVFDSTATFKEVGLSGITITAYNAAGASVGTTTSNATGNYTIAAVSGAVRVEFTGFASFDFSAPKGTGSGTSIQFVTAPATDVSFGVNYPQDYAQSDPQIAVPCFTFGPPSLYPTGPAVVSDKFSKRVSSGSVTHDKTWTTNQFIGATNGLAYSRTRDQLFVSAFLKRYTGFGPGDGVTHANGSPGAIYRVTSSGTVTTLIDLPASEIGTNPHINTVDFQRDPAWWEVGTMSWGDIDISDDETKIYAMNLFNRKLYEIDINTGTVLNSYAIPGITGGVAFTGPTSNNNTDLRPFGLKFYRGKIYVGVVCAAESQISVSPTDGDNPNVQGFVFTFTPGVGFSGTPVANFPMSGNPTTLTYLKDITTINKGFTMWYPQSAWIAGGSNWTASQLDGFTKAVISDIEFINGDMVIGIRDLIKDVFANQNGTYYPDGITPVSANEGALGSQGRVYRLSANATNTVFTMENNGVSDGVAGYNTTNYYRQFNTHVHGDLYGGIATLNGHNAIMSNSQPGSSNGAIMYLDDITGAFSAQGARNKIYDYDGTLPLPNPLFAKSNGLGDIEVLANPAPLEIGNRVFSDTDSDGIQDAGEAGIDGVTVKLFKGATEVGSTTTANGGQYYFNSTNVTGGILYNSDYEIRIVTAQAPLSNLRLTATDVGSSDLIDNDGYDGGTSAIKAFTTGSAGENNHSYDFGFTAVTCAVNLTANVSGCYDSNGNTAGGSSVATVQVIVDWSNNPSGETINVTCTGATAQSINPATASKPTILTFIVPANGAAVTVTATFSTTTTCTETQIVTAPTGTCLLTPCVAGNTGGTVWRDFNNDGIKDAGETQGITGVTVKAYDCNGNLVETVTTDYLGQYTFTTLTPSATNKYRLEFSNYPPQYKPTFNGANGKTDVQFILSASCTVHFGVNTPTDYCQANPQIATTCFINGLANATTPNDALVRWAYDNTGSTSKIGDKIQIGAAWGVAYQRQSNKLFLAAYAKRHVDWGPLGSNGLYVTTNANTIGTTANTASFVNLNTINPAFDAGTVVRNFSGSTNPTQPNHDQNMFPLVGKIGLGDIEVSEDGSYLYVMNLNDRKLWRVEIGQTGTAPTVASQIVDYSALPNPCTNSTFRPFAVKAYKGEIYVGGVCDGVSVDGTTVDRNNLKLTVYKTTASATPNSAVWTSVLDYPLTFNRLAHANGGYGNGLDTADYYDSNGTNMTLSNTSWHPWARNFGEISLVKAAAQPVLMNIEFDVDGSMVLGISDRTGDIAGHQNYGTNTGSTTLYIVDAPGDIMRAANVNGTFFMEANGTAGGTTTAGAGNGDGPGGGEFYFHDRYGYVNATSLPFGNLVPSPTLPGYNHEETTLGGLALIPGTGKVLVTAFDPQYTASGNGFYTGGIRYYSNSDGTATNARTLYNTTNAATFGKSNGLGDIEALCDPAPIQIGNYVWLDQDKDGVQDPCETPLSNVTVSLWKSGVQIATTTTNASGEYYFSSKSNLAVPANWTGTGVDTTLLPNMAYEVRILKTQPKLDTTTLTVANATTNSGNDQNDSDATMTGNDAIIAFTTGAAGSTNHTLDFGFYGVCTKPNAGLDQDLSCGTTSNRRATSKLIPNIPGGIWSSPSSQIIFKDNNDTTFAFVAGKGVYDIIYTVGACSDSIKVTFQDIPTSGCRNLWDGLNVPLTVGTDILNSPVYGTVLNAQAIGGETDLSFELIKTDFCFGDNAKLINGGFNWNNGPGCYSKVVLSWDGIDNSALALNPTGLGGMNFSGAGNFGFIINSVDQARFKFTLRLYTDAANISESIFMMNQSGNLNSNIPVEFNSFTTTAGTGANLSNIGAVQLIIEPINLSDDAHGIDMTTTCFHTPCLICTAPTLTNVAATSATCTNGVANNNATVNVTGIANMVKYAYRTNATDSLWANTATASTATSINLTGLTNPSVATTYTFRIWGADTTCYNDTTVVLNPKNCTVVKACSGGLIGNNDFEQGGTVNPEAFAGGLRYELKSGSIPSWDTSSARGNEFRIKSPMAASGEHFVYAFAAGTTATNDDVCLQQTGISVLPNTKYVVCVYAADAKADGKQSGIALEIVEKNASNGISVPLHYQIKALVDNPNWRNDSMSLIPWTLQTYTFTTSNTTSSVDMWVSANALNGDTSFVVFDYVCLQAAPIPIITSIGRDAATCTNGVTNADAAVFVRGITGMAKYAYGTNGTTGLFANTATASTADSIRISNIANPSVATTYTFRIYMADTTCYNDTTVVLTPSVCPPCSITATFTQGSCNNNGTTVTGADDYFTVNVSAVSATNGGTSGKYEVLLNGMVLNAGGTDYGTSVTVGTTTTFKSDGATTYQLKVRDANITSCETTIYTTTVSAACSTIPCPPQICIPVTVTRN